MREPAVHDARDAWVVARPWLAWPIATAVLCLLLALLGAVDSYAVPFVVRLAFWGGLFAVAILFAIGIEAVLLRSGLSPAPVWKWSAVFAFLLALTMTPVAYAANSLAGWAPLSMLTQHFANSLVISIAYVGLRIAIGRIVWQPENVSARVSGPVALMGRLQLGLRDARLLALEADGHYVRVHTDMGTEMVLMRLKDAIGETRGIEGLQVHRSWWVARAAIEGGKPRDGSLKLAVEGKLEVPVSRNRKSELRATGWLD